MRPQKSIFYSKIALMVINLVAIVYNASIYLFATNYVAAKGFSHSLLERLDAIPGSPSLIFWVSISLYACLLLVMYYRERHPNQLSVYDKATIIEILLMLVIFSVLHSSYNGLILLVFADIFYGSKEFNSSKDKKYWFSFIILSFSMLLLSNYDLMSLFIKLPSLDTYIRFYPESVRLLLLFGKNFLYSLNIVVFMISLLFYILSAITERHRIEEELRMASQANRELNSYLALSEKIAEDRERKRIAREIHDTLGHALTGISAGIDAVKVLVDIDTNRAKEQLNNVSVVVRDGIRDVRGSLNKMRPGALENNTLKEALIKIIREYEAISNLEIHLRYEWDNIDLDIAKEDIVFRVIQESITNSVRHGHAKTIWIELLEEESYVMTIQDDGIGFDELHYGYGLKQMQERLMIIGGSVRFENRDGFYTHIEIPKIGGRHD
ncbi:two component system histidine kinase [Streptococcus sanguinis SK1 = NCTC 7863]|jgi:histidine kinase, putative|uniref:histidine kinase n=1 Tax=Streptococcus sanguinis SK405 TaxID=888817 RepID=A0ABC9PBE0_STRSA|nr:sensor histidine kinase [Streptococcus sanguinis]EGC24201.1 histidine kinase [Streptococcus sanguinis SK405]EGF05933.1 two component system histidine kinase [Streptococcus sanguinis SK1 = NCTC 7863]EGF22613.1 two component system histidine kinase [Streptococcus sanguinis SK1058]MBZ2076095.1 sensor histidine kinase [Streptococcus sanguinis]MCY7025951.1 sensor histidine kinase [Streptococcus sanguinis]